ncbi:MAG: ankyrin repeat domain-containing protein, partial [Akkermansia sp.]|nr:ankyrin repeat domain-containing protein [Akkermansia sp.]
TDPECVRLLLEAGAKPNLRNSAKATPLMRAVEYNRPDIVRLLLQHGAHPHTPDCTGHSPLVEAILKGYTECADILIGAKPGKKERERYFADALEAARQQGNTRLIEKLQNHLP